jgi:hypothetical protein
MVVLAILDKNRGCVSIDYQPEAHTLDPTFFDFWWRPFLGQKSVGVSLGSIENGGFLVDDQWPHNPIFVKKKHERPFSIIPKANTYGFLT